jgi:hypothetical protein
MPSAVSLLKAVDDHNAAVVPGVSSLDYRLEDLVLDPASKKVRFKQHAEQLDISGTVLDSGISLTIEGASEITLTILDKKLSLLNGDLLTGWAWGTNADERDEDHWIKDGRKVDAQLDDLWFRLVKVEKQSKDVLLLTLEDREVAKLRAHRGARKMYRERFTRAQFVAALCRAAGVRYFIPEINERQPVAKVPEPVTAEQRKSESRKGVSSHANITVKGPKATAAQLRNIQDAMDVAAKLNAPELAQLAMCCAGIAESGFTTVINSKGYGGVFQGQVNTGGHYFKASETTKEAYYFLKGGKGFQGGGAIHLAHQHQSPGQIASTVEGSGESPGFYGQHIGEAKKIVKAFHGGGSLSTSVSTDVSAVVEKPYAFARGKNENSWDAINRLAAEVQWRAFIRQIPGSTDRGVWFVSDDWIKNQAPAYHLIEGEGPVDEITFEVDIRARDLVTELQATVQATSFALLPGMLNTVEGQGVADGRWPLVQVEKSLTDPVSTLTHHKPIRKKPEPAPETTQVSLTAGGNLPQDVAEPVGRFVAKAVEISGHDYAYSWGGGHNAGFAPSGPHHGYDCSGLISACAHAAGWLSSPLTSGLFESWGRPGRGKYITVYASGNHVFAFLHGLGKYKRVDTSPQGAGERHGPHIRTKYRSTAGFVARHFPGF